MSDSTGPAIDLSIAFHGGDAEEHRLDFYDGAESLFGLARTLRLTTHYLLNGEVLFQAPSAKGAKLVMLPSRPGSFDQIVQILVENAETVIGGLTIGITSNVVWDFIKYSVSRTLGKQIAPTTSVVATIASQREPDLDALSEAIDGPILNAHRFVSKTPGGFISLGPKKGPPAQIVTLNSVTHDYVKQRRISNQPETIFGSIASYNVNSKRGRIFDPALGRTVPFIPEKESSIDYSPLSWSLDQGNRGLDGTIKLKVLRVTTINEDTKQYILLDCSRI